MDRSPELSLHEKHVRQLAKTEMCKFFLANRCRKGAHCPFAHSLTEIREKPDLNRTSMCKEFLQTGRCDDLSCTYAHDERELRTTVWFFKTKLCKFAVRGRCKHGSNCHFAHSLDELNANADFDGAAPSVTSDGSTLTGPLNSQSLALSNVGSSSAQFGFRSADVGTSNGHNDGSGESGGSSAAQGVSSHWTLDSAAGTPLLNNLVRFEGGASGSQQSGSSGGSAEGTSDEPASNLQGGLRRNAHAASSDRSTRVDTSASASVPTPIGSGDSSQEAGDGQGEGEGEGSDKAQPEVDRPQQGQRSGTGADRGRHCTTMMITNIPNFLTQGALLSLFEDRMMQMRGSYDFFYCPWDPYQDRNLGYAIINFFTRSAAAEFERQWVNQLLVPRSYGTKRLRILAAAIQGRAAHLRHFSGFSLAHHKDPRFRPLVRASPNAVLRPMAVSEELPCNTDLQQTDNGSSSEAARPVQQGRQQRQQQQAQRQQIQQQQLEQLQQQAQQQQSQQQHFQQQQQLEQLQQQAQQQQSQQQQQMEQPQQQAEQQAQQQQRQQQQQQHQQLQQKLQQQLKLQQLLQLQLLQQQHRQQQQQVDGLMAPSGDAPWPGQQMQQMPQMRQPSRQQVGQQPSDDYVPSMEQAVGEMQNRAEMLLSQLSAARAKLMDSELLQQLQAPAGQQRVQPQQLQSMQQQQPQRLQAPLWPTHSPSLTQQLLPQGLSHQPLQQQDGFPMWAGFSRMSSNLQDISAIEGGRGAYTGAAFTPFRSKAAFGSQGMPGAFSSQGLTDEELMQQCWMLQSTAAGCSAGASSSQGAMTTGLSTDSGLGDAAMCGAPRSCTQQVTGSQYSASKVPLTEAIAYQSDNYLYSD